MAINTYVSKRLGSHKLTASQTDILVYLFFRDGRETNQKDIEKHMDLTNPTISGILQRLEKRGLIVRTPSPTIPTAKHIALTDKARTLQNILKEAVLEIEAAICREISPEDLDTFHGVLLKMHDNIKNSYGQQIFET
jgi:DNA-binding MarR family transcriptional regulator